jgi:hypothetical protein
MNWPATHDAVKHSNGDAVFSAQASKWNVFDIQHRTIPYFIFLFVLYYFGLDS